MRAKALPVLVALLLVLAGCSGGDLAGAGGDAGSIGLSAGGAADATAFRNNVEHGYVPQPTDMTVEGLYHDYYFDTGQTRPCEAMFCPSYARAVTRDPLSNATERYLAVGLNSGLSAADFERKQLNLVVVLDTSGSMSAAFPDYYYDGGETQTVESEQSKMQAATQAVTGLTSHLEADDRFGLVTYDNDAQVVQPLGRVGDTDMDHVRRRVRGLGADGGTNLDAGMTTATGMLEPYRDANQSTTETRIIYVTDAMPNRGDTGGQSLEARLRANADHRVHSTFVGVGVDFNSRLVETINAVPGANYYTVHSPSAFRDRMVDGFDHMVTPLVYNLSMHVASDGYAIETVYGSPTAEAATGEMMSVQTLFPSRREANRTEGGIILVKLRRTGESDRLRLRTTYETRIGERRSSTRTVRFGAHEPPFYDTTGVRKAVVLARYADLMRNWAAYERARGADTTPVSADAGIEHRDDLGEWEQQSVPLRVSPPYDSRIARFARYFEREAAALGSERFATDAAVLETLRTNASTGASPSAASAASG